MKNYYEILEVNENASKEIINKVFKIHIKKNHPDLFQDEEKTKMEEKVKKINEAYDTLSDETKRNLYDEKLKEEKEDIENEKLKNFNFVNINDQTDKLKEENEFLKELVFKKDKIISDFLSNPLHVKDNINFKKIIEEDKIDNTIYNEYYNSNNNNINDDYKSTFTDFSYYNKQFFFKLLFAITFVIAGLFLMGTLLNTNLFVEIFNTLLYNK